jgi:2-oxoglutarate dehydrogenase complex dehydrogenase (E1) component-like enzyme
VVFTPKSLLRARSSRSPLVELTTGSFRTVVDDPSAFGGLSTPGSLGTGSGAVPSAVVDPAAVRRVLLCSGKIAFDAMGRRDQLAAQTPGLPAPGVPPTAVAVVRVEQLYPWPEDALGAVLDRYPSAHEVFWVQEEPENMGAWSFAHGRLHKLLRDRFTLIHVSRSESASPATGSAALHHLEHEDILARAFA